MSGRDARRSDALVLFGATGDLAHKKIFPSLYAMTKRGHLDVPVIGVASEGWDVDLPYAVFDVGVNYSPLEYSHLSPPRSSCQSRNQEHPQGFRCMLT